MKVQAADPRLLEDSEVTLYTRIRRHEGKFYVFQAVNTIPLPYDGNAYSPKVLPWVPLTWNLPRGCDWGIGMVEDSAGDFHALSVLSEAIVLGAAIAADIKFLVDPTGNTDVNALNKAASGSFVPGRKDDISALSLDKAQDWNMVLQVLSSYEKRIGLTFLLGSAVTRDAERVTAEEIRHQANELETSLGGQYSRFGVELQLPLAYITLAETEFDISGGDKVEPMIITGLDALSRNSDMEALMLYFQDLAITAQLPEQVQEYLKVRELMQVFGAARGVDYEKFTKDDATVQQERQQRQQQEMQAVQNAEAAKAQNRPQP
jgi:hypothetical protein